MVPPNSIDWDAVSAGFANLDENLIVFAVVVSIIGVYFILLVWVRRLDKKDLKEVNIRQLSYSCQVKSFISKVSYSVSNIILDPNYSD